MNMSEKKKDNDKKVDDKAGLVIEGHIVIRDKETKKEIVNKRS